MTVGYGSVQLLRGFKLTDVWQHLFDVTVGIIIIIIICFDE